jgi:hypothetical protein
MLRTILLLVCATSVLTACDEGADAPDDEFRDGTVCLVGVTPPSTTIKNKGVPDPDDPKSQWVQLAVENTDEIMFSIASLEFDMQSECKVTCDAEGLGWTGDPCIGKRDYTFDDPVLYETSEGEPRYSISGKTGNTEVGCVCK